jgi:hypothetical protein
MATLALPAYNADNSLQLPAVTMKIANCLFVFSIFLASSPALAVDLSAYGGAYPFDEVGGYPFFENPAVKRAIDAAAGDGISDWLAELAVGVPIEQQDDGMIAIACEQHNCSGNNAAVAISISGSLIAACLYSEDGEHGASPGTLRWVSPRFDKEMSSPGSQGCPQDTSEFLDAYARVLK